MINHFEPYAPLEACMNCWGSNMNTDTQSGKRALPFYTSCDLCLKEKAYIFLRPRQDQLSRMKHISFSSDRHALGKLAKGLFVIVSRSAGINDSLNSAGSVTKFA